MRLQCIDEDSREVSYLDYFGLHFSKRSHKFNTGLDVGLGGERSHFWDLVIFMIVIAIY